jgi:hypothetical protein
MEHRDRLEKGIRFGCGFLLGCVLAVGWLLTLVSGHVIAAGSLAAGLLCGYAAMKFGDRFWQHLIRWWV